VLLLMFGTGFAVPVIGFLAVVAGILILHRLPARGGQHAFRAIELPEIDVHQRSGTGFRQAGMRSFLSNARAPVATRMRALVALQNVSGRVASPLLRDVLTDPSEDIRLLAYGMLDNKEKFLNGAIHRESQRLQAAAEGSAEQVEATKKLADLYWELVYQELAQGDLRTHALQRSLDYTRRSLARSPEDAALHLRLGRLLQSLGQPAEADAAYHQALTLGMPKTRIVPYLAEVAYDLGDFATVRRLMHELGDWQSLPRLKPVIAYWSRS
jgi:tetratricopeptide (TPR) repeat protein